MPFVGLDGAVEFPDVAGAVEFPDVAGAVEFPDVAGAVEFPDVAVAGAGAAIAGAAAAAGAGVTALFALASLPRASNGEGAPRVSEPYCAITKTASIKPHILGCAIAGARSI